MGSLSKQHVPSFPCPNRAYTLDVQTILIYLAIVHNPALLKHLYLSSGDNLSDEQRRDKYDAVVVSAAGPHFARLYNASSKPEHCCKAPML